MKVSFIIHTPWYRHTTDGIAKHLKCRYAFHTSMEQVHQYKPDVTVSGLHFHQTLGKKQINIYAGHGLTWAGGIWSSSNRWYDYLIVISDFVKNEIVHFNIEPEKEIWITGWPMFDNLFTKKVRPRIFNNAKRPIIFYAPTGGGVASSYSYIPDLHTLIPRSATLMIKPHPVPGIDARKIAEKNIKDFTNIIILDRHKNPSDYIPYVDLVISDKSTILFHSLAVPEKPVIQCVFSNLAEYWQLEPRAQRCIEYKWQDAWKQIRSKEELKRAIVEELKNPMRNYQTRKKYGDILFGNLRDGKSGQRIAEKIMGLKI